MAGNLTNLKPWGVDNPPPKSPGRPKKRPLTESYDERLREILPESVRRAMNLPKGSDWADAISLGMVRKAAAGDVTAAKEMGDRTEGKAPQRIEIATPKDREIKLRIEWGSAPIDVAGEVVEQTLARVVENVRDTASADEKEESAE